MMDEIDRFEAVYPGDPEAFCVDLEELRIKAAVIWDFSIEIKKELRSYSVRIWPNEDREICFEILLDGISSGGPTKLEVICRGDPYWIKELQRLWDMLRYFLNLKGEWRTEKFAQEEEKRLSEESEKECISDDLTGRQKEVLEYLLEPMTQRNIAKELGVGFNTLKTHKARIYKILDVHSRDELRELAEEEGWFRGADFEGDER